MFGFFDIFLDEGRLENKNYSWIQFHDVNISPLANLFFLPSFSTWFLDFFEVKVTWGVLSCWRIQSCCQENVSINRATLNGGFAIFSHLYGSLAEVNTLDLSLNNSVVSSFLCSIMSSKSFFFLTFYCP